MMMMDGDDMVPSGLPWIDPVTDLHSSREHSCKLTPEQCAYTNGYWRNWYEDDHRYALPTVGLFSGVIFVFFLAFLFPRVMPARVTQATPVKKATALGRYLSYRIFRINGLNWNSAPIGVLLLGALGTIYFLGMTLGPRPFYWPNTKTVTFGGSPALATRSGWLSLACLPFVIATAAKSNFITAVTGVPHEKLQVFHRWTAYAFFVTALMHTFPFIVYHIKTGDIVTQWHTSSYYWTGVIAIISQAWLTFASFSPLRNLCYEAFKFMHYLAALVFAVFLLIHCDFTLSSADYFIAAGVLFSLSWLHSQLRVVFEHGIGTKATLALTPNNFIRVSVPTRSTWTVGQHVFIRFLSPGLEPWGSHPFTICSLPQRVSFYDAKESEFVFYIRPQGGLTSRLERYISSQPGASVRVSLDGPYGGVDMQKIVQSDRMLVIAGGSGAGWTLPFVECHLRRLEMMTVKKGASACGCGTSNDDAASAAEPLTLPSLRVILATRDRTTRRWFERMLAELVAASTLSEADKQLAVEVHYTGEDASTKSLKLSETYLPEIEDPEKAFDAAVRVDSRSGSDSDVSSKEERGVVRSVAALGIEEYVARPDLPAIIAAEANVSGSSSMGIFVCGPAGMQKDVADAAAAQQLRVWKEGKGEVYLHMEHFAWA